MVGIVPFYVDRWLAGTNQLSLEEEGAFIRWVASYASRDGLFPDDVKLFAKVWRCNVRRAKRLRSALFAAGKLYREGEFVHQVLAKFAVTSAISKSEQATNAAYKRWQNHRENNDGDDTDASADASADSMRTHMRLLEKKERKLLSLERASGLALVENHPSARSLASAPDGGALAREPSTELEEAKRVAEQKAPQDRSLADINLLKYGKMHP